MGTKISELTVKVTLDGTETFPCNDGGTTKQCSADAILGRAFHVDPIALGDADTPGGILAWQNPAGVDIIVAAVTLFLAVSAADTDDSNYAAIGVAADGTTSSETINAVAPLGNAGAARVVGGFVASQPVVCPADHYVTISTGGGSAAGIVGTAYIYWHAVA
jgi:hypothetical protein